MLPRSDDDLAVADVEHALWLFLINAVVETEPNAPLTVWVNWAAGAPK